MEHALMKEDGRHSIKSYPLAFSGFGSKNFLVIAQEYDFPVGREVEVLAQIRWLKLLPTRLV
jgi:hypothetical protein